MVDLTFKQNLQSLGLLEKFIGLLELSSSDQVTYKWFMHIFD